MTILMFQKVIMNTKNDFDQLAGILDYFAILINYGSDTNIYKQENFIFKDVIADGNCDFKSISLQLF